MKFKVRKVGNSYGIIIPKGFVSAFSEEDEMGKFIEMEFTMSKEPLKPGEEPIAVDEILATEDDVVYTEEDNEW